MFSLRKAGHHPSRISDEFPERTERAVESKWQYKCPPVDFKVEWTELEDQQLQNFHREGNDCMSIGSLIPGPRHTAGDCLIRYLEIHGSLPYPCPTASAFPWAPRDRNPGQYAPKIERTGVRLPHKYPAMMSWTAVTIGTTTTGILIRIGLKISNRYVAFRQPINDHGLVDAASTPTTIDISTVQLQDVEAQADTFVTVGPSVALDGDSRTKLEGENREEEAWILFPLTF